MTWLQAQAYCESVDATLAVVHSARRNQELMDFAQANGHTTGLSQFWIGGNDADIEVLSCVYVFFCC